MHGIRMFYTVLFAFLAPGFTLAQTAFMQTYGPAQPPHGFVSFCDRSPAECAVRGDVSASRFYATPARLRELDDVNRSVNRAIEPATDLEIYGVNEYWTLPRRKGDCEDYVLLKRQRLINKGWPSGALLITVVLDENDEGHAILTVRTTHGDYILDNKIKDVRLWYETPYKIVMRQSPLNPRVWLAIDTNIKTATAP